MGLVVLVTLAGIILVGAVLFGWVLIATHPRLGGSPWRERADDIERIVAVECSDLDTEYERLLAR